MPSRNDLEQTLRDLMDYQAMGRAIQSNDPVAQAIVRTRRELNDLRKDEQKLADDRARHQRAYMYAATAAVAAIVKIKGELKQLRSAGMENTVEANRLNLAYTLLGREVAAVFLPATTAATNASMVATKALGGLTRKGQDAAFVLGYAAESAAVATAAWLVLGATGTKLTGIMGGLVRILPLLGLAGGALIGMAALFLSTEQGARTLQSTMEMLVRVTNELGNAFDTIQGKFGNNGWLDRATTGFAALMAKAGEQLGLVPAGTVQEVLKQHDANIQNFRMAQKPNEEKRRSVTPAQFRFEGVRDPFERVATAAAKLFGGQSIEEKQLNAQERTAKATETLVGDQRKFGNPPGQRDSGVDF